jgi:hypothetical protein
MNVSILPKASQLRSRSLGDTLDAAGKPLDQPEPVPPARPTQDDIKALEEQLQVAANWDAFDMRGACALNMMKLSMAQGKRDDVTGADMAHFRAIMGLAGLWVAGNPNAEVPSGFGEPVRVEMAKQVQEALAVVMASVAVPEDIQAGATGADK